MRDGRIEQVGAPAEVYQRPVSRFVAGFLGASNFLRGRVIERCNGTILVDVPQGPTLSVSSTRPVGSEVTLALRPEAVIIETAGASAAADGVPNMTPAVIEQIIYHGFATHLHLRLPQWRSADRLRAEPGRGGSATDPAGYAGSRSLDSGKQPGHQRRARIIHAPGCCRLVWKLPHVAGVDAVPEPAQALARMDRSGHHGAAASATPNASATICIVATRSAVAARGSAW